jgi:menaquinol-cytochrome c reductase iron-sulfur subunit
VSDAVAAPSRRSLLGLLSAGLGALAAAAAGVPVLGAALTPWIRPRPRSGGQRFAVCSTLELEPGVPKRVDLHASARDAWAVQDNTTIGSVWLVKGADGRVGAFSTICPHLGCPIGYGGAGTFHCPCHDSDFKLDGSQVTGPSARGMDVLDVEVKDNVVSVRYARFTLGSKDKQEI